MHSDDVQFDAQSPNNGTRTLTWVFNDDAGGNANDSNSFATNVDVAFGPQITGLVGQPVNGGTVELQVTGINVGDTINLYADGTNTIVGTGTVVVAGGTFDITTSGTFADAVHTFVAQEINTRIRTCPNRNRSPSMSIRMHRRSTMLVGQPINGGTVELHGHRGDGRRHHRSLCRQPHQHDCRHRHGPGRWQLRHHHHGDLHR